MKSVLFRHNNTLSRRRQSWVIFVALCAMVMVLALVPMRDGDSRADAANKVAGQPDCGPNDDYRNNLLLGSNDRVYPCLSKVNLRMSSDGGTGTNFFTIANAKVIGTDTLRYADGSTETGLLHLTFKDFRVMRDMTMTIGDVSGSGANAGNVQNPPYRTKIKPDASAQIGGTGVDVDLWVTPRSRFGARILFCIQVDAEDIASGILALIANGNTLTGCMMDLQIRFMTVNGSGNTFPVQLPNTTISVTG